METTDQLTVSQPLLQCGATGTGFTGVKRSSVRIHTVAATQLASLLINDNFVAFLAMEGQSGQLAPLGESTLPITTAGHIRDSC